MISTHRLTLTMEHHRRFSRGTSTCRREEFVTFFFRISTKKSSQMKRGRKLSREERIKICNWKILWLLLHQGSGSWGVFRGTLQLLGKPRTFVHRDGFFATFSVFKSPTNARLHNGKHFGFHCIRRSERRWQAGQMGNWRKWWSVDRTPTISTEVSATMMDFSCKLISYFSQAGR